jgi:hypothetical protein
MENLPKQGSITKQVLVLLFSGLILSVGSCAGFIQSVSKPGTLTNVFALGFGAGLLIMLGTVVWAIAHAVRQK